MKKFVLKSFKLKKISSLLIYERPLNPKPQNRAQWTFPRFFTPAAACLETNFCKKNLGTINGNRKSLNWWLKANQNLSLKHFTTFVDFVRRIKILPEKLSPRITIQVVAQVGQGPTTNTFVDLLSSTTSLMDEKVKICVNAKYFEHQPLRRSVTLAKR